MFLKEPKSLGVLLADAQESLAVSLAELGASGVKVVLTLKGNPDTLIKALAAANKAGPGVLAFATSADYLAIATQAGAAAVIVPPELAEHVSLPALITSEPRLLFAVLLAVGGRIPAPVAGEAFFVDKASVTFGSGVVIGPYSYIGKNVQIGDNTVIGSQAYLDEGVVVGHNCIIHPRAVLRWGVRVGSRCQIHSGAIIGEDGFGYTQLPHPESGRLFQFKNAHLGGVLLEDDVEVGANTTIDRGLVSDTVVGRGSKIDNLVQIGHNVQMGQDCIVVSQVGIGGHSTIGDRAFLLGQVGIGPGVNIGADVVLGGQAGLPSGNVPAGRKLWLGTPARPSEDTYKTMALATTQLPKLRKFLNTLKAVSSFDELKNVFFATDQKSVAKAAPAAKATKVKK